MLELNLGELFEHGSEGVMHFADCLKFVLDYFDCAVIVIRVRDQLLDNPIARIRLHALRNIPLEEPFEVSKH